MSNADWYFWKLFHHIYHTQQVFPQEALQGVLQHLSERRVSHRHWHQRALSLARRCTLKQGYDNVIRVIISCVYHTMEYRLRNYLTLLNWEFILESLKWAGDKQWGGPGRMKRSKKSEEKPLEVWKNLFCSVNIGSSNVPNPNLTLTLTQLYPNHPPTFPNQCLSHCFRQRRCLMNLLYLIEEVFFNSYQACSRKFFTYLVHNEYILYALYGSQ